MARTFRSSRPDGWTLPFWHRDPTYRHMSHGPIVPLEKPTFLERLLGRH
jgi:hypothetical protein